MRRQMASLLMLVCAALVHAQSQTTLQPKEGDFVLHDFHFRSGETLPELRLHYATLGTPVRDAHGKVQNAVIILHGTTRTGKVFLNPAYMVLYGSGQPLDLSRWYVILRGVRADRDRVRGRRGIQRMSRMICIAGDCS